MSNTDDEEEAVRVQFIIEQLKLCNQSEQGRRYSPGVTIFAYTIYSTSTAAYKALLRQNTVILPSISTLKRVTKRLDSKSGLDNSEYISLRASKLNNFGMHIILMIDEIYLGKRVELSGGDIYGFTEDGVVAHTALCFMIRSLTSKYRLFGDIMDIVVGEHFDIFLGKTHCTKGHDIIQEMTVRFFNTMAKNFVKDISADATLAAKKRQRKALKLSGAST